MPSPTSTSVPRTWSAGCAPPACSEPRRGGSRRERRRRSAADREHAGAPTPARADAALTVPGHDRDPDGRAPGTARGGRAAAPARVVARRELPLGRPDLPARQPAPARAAAPRARQAAPARPLGHHAGLNFVYAHLNRVIRAQRPRRALRHRPGPRRARPRRQHLPRGHLQRGLSRHHARRGGPAAAVPAVLLPGRHPQPRRARRRPGSIHEGGELGYALVHAYGAAFDNPDLLVALRRRRRRGGDRPARRQLALQQVRRPGARRRGAARSCTSTATRSPTRPCWRGSRDDELRALLVGYGHEPYFVEGDDPATMHAAHGRDARPGPRRHRGDPARAREGAGERPRWPMIVLRTPKGWTGPKEVDGRARRGHVPRPPGAAVGPAPTTRSTSPRSRRGCAPTGPRSSSTTPGGSARAPGARARGRAAHGRQPARQRRRCCCATCGCPTSATTRVALDAPGARPARPRACSAAGCATSCAPTPTSATSGSSGPTRPPRTGSAPSSRPPTARGWRSAAAATTTSPRTAASWRSSASTSARAGSRATC